jgi:putative peptidoglycan lipid II flippase
MNLRFRRPRLTPGMKRLILLGLPGIVTAGITQVNITVGTMIASQQASAVSYLYYADRVNQLPLGIVGIAIGVVLLPELSRQLASGNVAGAMASQNRSLEFALLLTLPAAAALMVIPFPIIAVLFERGAFSQGDSMAVAVALAAYAAGLPAFVMTRVFLPGFFAREDIRTPMIFAAAGMVTNIALALILFPRMGHVGLAIAASAAGWLNAMLLFATLVRRGHFRADKAFARRIPLILLSAGLMSAGLWFAERALSPYFEASNAAGTRLLALALLIGVGALTYAISAQITGAFRYSNLRKAFARV